MEEEEGGVCEETAAGGCWSAREATAPEVEAAAAGEAEGDDTGNKTVFFSHLYIKG